MGWKVKRAEHFLTVRGLRTHVVESGVGEPLVLVHGLSGPLMWQRVVEPLSDHFHVIVVDLPGWGDSECSRQRFSAKMYSDFLIQLLDILEVKKAILAGISYGGQISVEAAYQAPGRIEKLILICSTGLSGRNRLLENDISWWIISRTAKCTVLRSRSLMCLLARRSFYDTGTRPRDLCEQFSRQLSQIGKRDAWLNGLRNTLVPGVAFERELLQIRIPTLIIWGENDRTIPVGIAKRFEDSLPDSTLKVFSKCAHSVPLEKPEELCEAIIDFHMITDVTQNNVGGSKFETRNLKSQINSNP